MGAPSEEARRLADEEEAEPSLPGLPGVGVAERSSGERVPRLAPSLNSVVVKRRCGGDQRGSTGQQG